MTKAAPNSTSPSVAKRDSKEALLDAAERLFSEQGFVDVSTRQIAEAAGVNLGLIQYHFGSKANLFVAVVHRMKENACYQPAVNALGTFDATRAGAATAIAHYCREYVAAILRPNGPSACRLIFREVMNDTGREPEMVDALINSVASDFTGPMEDRLARAIKVLRPQDSDAVLRLQAHCVMGICSFYATHRPFIEKLRGEDFSCDLLYEKAWTTVAKFALRALGADEKLLDEALAGARCCPSKPAG